MKHDLFWMITGISALLAVLLGAVFSLLKRSGKAGERRRQRMRGLAESLGLRYYGTAGRDALSLLPSCSLLEEGRPITVANLIGEKRNPPRLLLFDYERAYGFGGRPSELDGITLHLVAMARAPGRPAITPLRVYREDWFGGPVGVKGVYKLQFKTDATFSDEYWLKGEPPDEVRAMLTEPLRETIKNWQGRGPMPVVEIVPGWVVVHVESHPNDREVAQRGAGLLNYATSIAQQLADRSRG